MARVSKELKALKDMLEEEERINEEELELIDTGTDFFYSLKDGASYIVDNRINASVYHSLESILLTVIFGILANCNTFVEIHLFAKKHFDWLNKYVTFDCGLPSISTFKRVIAMINPEELEELCTSLVEEFISKYNKKTFYEDNDLVIEDIDALDGKTANSSDRKSSKNGEIAKMNAMSAMSVKNSCCVATKFISDKTNEIPTGPELLKMINIKNHIITFDAMSTQKKTIEYIVNHGAYFVAPAKGNQETLEEDIKLYFEDKELYEKAKNENFIIQKEKAHGSLETREYVFTNDISWMRNRDEWKGLKSIGIAKRTYQNKDGEMVTDIRYYISNLDASKIEIISKTIRGEWTIENQLHFYLDTVFKEDANRCFLDNSQKNLNIIRKFCLTLLKEIKKNSKLSMNSIRFNISMDFDNEINDLMGTINRQ